MEFPMSSTLFRVWYYEEMHYTAEENWSSMKNHVFWSNIFSLSHLKVINTVSFLGHLTLLKF